MMGQMRSGNSPERLKGQDLSAAEWTDRRGQAPRAELVGALDAHLSIGSQGQSLACNL